MTGERRPRYRELRITFLGERELSADAGQGPVRGDFSPERYRQLSARLLARYLQNGLLTVSELTEIGAHLYQALFPEKIEVLFHRTLERAQANRARLPVILKFDGPEDERLGWPWEFMHRPAQNGRGGLFLGAHPDVILSRQIPRTTEVAPSNSGTVTMLVVSSPGATSGPERDPVVETLKKYQGPGVTVVPLDRPTRKTFLDALKISQPQVVHFIGCGDGDGLRLEDDASGPDCFKLSPPRVLFLQAPGGAPHEASEGLGNLAVKLIGHVPCVLAARSSEMADGFALRFYAALRAGSPIDEAVQMAREEMHPAAGKPFDSRAFGCPRVWLQAVLDDSELVLPFPVEPVVPVAVAGTAASPPSSRATGPTTPAAWPDPPAGNPSTAGPDPAGADTEVATTLYTGIGRPIDGRLSQPPPAELTIVLKLADGDRILAGLDEATLVDATPERDSPWKEYKGIIEKLRAGVDVVDDQTQQELGGRLFTALMPPPVLATYRDALRTATTSAPLHLQLLFHPNDEAADKWRIAGLPWELLWDRDELSTLAVNRTVTLTRRLKGMPRAAARSGPGPGFLVYYGAASPAGYATPLTTPELKALRALEDKKSVMKVDERTSLTRDQFIATMEEEPRDDGWLMVFHFSGHGLPGKLVLENREREPEEFEATKIRDVVMGNAPALVVLNCCLGAVQPDQDHTPSIAEGFIQGRVPTVVAMQGKLPDAAGLKFVETFYSYLTQGFPPTKAIQYTRNYLKTLAGPPSWAMIAVYTQAKTGALVSTGGRGAVTVRAANLVGGPLQ